MIDQIVEGALRELSDEEVQARLWSSTGDRDVSSLAEAKSRLWDDSGLEEAMQRGVVYNDEIDANLRSLERTLNRIDDQAPIGVVLTDPSLATARLIATTLLASLREFGYER